MATDAASTAAGLPADLSPEPDALLEDKSDMLLGFNKLSLLRQVILMMGAAASVAVGIVIIMWASEPDYRPLFNDMGAYDATQVSEILQQGDIAYKVEPNSGALLIAAQDIHKARMRLAAAGLTQDQGLGFELLDQETGIGTSQFMETTRYRRGLEGELSRTIASLRNVKNARVHLAIPKDSVFVRDTRKPSASVLLELAGTRSLNPQQVEAIVNLVAGSVPQMPRDAVTVVDQSGNLLSQSDLSEEEKQTSREFAYARQLEEVLTRRVNSILQPVVGAERFRAEVSADVDFTAVEQAEEVFNTDRGALRSERELGEQRGDLGPIGIPGALTNQPPGNAVAPEEANADDENGGAGAAPDISNARQESVRNYEVDRTVSYIRHQQGKVQRLTVAVVLDDIRRLDAATGEVTYQPWPAEEIERITALVRNAVGYSAERGDSVTVVNSPFLAEDADFSGLEIPIWEQDWFREIIRWTIALIMVLVLVFGVIRPTFKNLTSAGAEAKDLALAGDAEGLAELEKLSSLPEEDSGLSTTDDFLLPGASEGYDRQVNALRGLIAEDPGRVAQVVRQWVMAED